MGDPLNENAVGDGEIAAKKLHANNELFVAIAVTSMDAMLTSAT